MNRHIRFLLGKGLLLGLCVALAGILLATSNIGRWMEEEVGLAWLFRLRGPLAAPGEVVVVSIDYSSSKRLGLANNPRKWPRSLHGDLVRKLNKHGAAVVVFDIFFEESRDPQENTLFAEALREAGNVILFQSLKKEPLTNAADSVQNRQVGYIETLTSPVPVLSEAAFGLGPFPLPKVPAQVNHFITFKPALGDIPTLPVVALAVHSLPVYSVLRDMVNDVIPERVSQLPTREQLKRLDGVHKLIQSLRKLFLTNPDLAPQLIRRLDHSSSTVTPGDREALAALISSYAQPDSLYLNFYGPPQTITTIPYYQVLESTVQANPLGLAGKAVFVGFSEQFQPEQKDGFYTVFSQELSGLDVSGVEIAATAFANLLQRSSIKTTSATADVLIYFTWAVLLSMVLRVLSGPILIIAALSLGLAYHQLAYELFRQVHHWIPLAIPLLWQAPLALIGALLWNYLDAQRARRNIRHAFGQHLPIDVVDQLAQGVEHIADSGQHVHGIVLATDAQQYTRLSEELTPAELHQLMNRYYEILFGPIRRSGGVISDVVGDASLAIWTSTRSDPLPRQRACHAALEILSRVERFNRQEPAYALPTRLGMHFGELIMGHVGAMDHYEYRAVGDIVNTASRIEGLNKQLGTRILVSKEVLQDIEGLMTRELGNFLLMGKSKPLSLYELVANDHQGKVDKPYVDFVRALHVFQAQQWEEAATGFEEFILEHGEDGPSRYYLDLCRQYLASPPNEWDGVIRVVKK
ncbi:MAG: adenylate/guanylate cyclase domain-containing protein [Gammaproteobacteria bacterium]